MKPERLPGLKRIGLKMTGFVPVLRASLSPAAFWPRRQISGAASFCNNCFAFYASNRQIYLKIKQKRRSQSPLIIKIGYDLMNIPPQHL